MHARGRLHFSIHWKKFQPRSLPLILVAYVHGS